MELNHLRYFFEVARAGSFTAAARSLRISQSALSKTVGLLEAREGVRLLERSKQGVVLTPLGAEVFRQAEKIFAAAAALSTTLRDFHEEVAGTLKLGASDHIANYLLAPQAGRLKAAYPRLLPSVTAGAPAEVADMVARDLLEFSLSFTPLKASGLVYEPLKSVPMAIVYRPDLVGRKPGLKELRALGFISSVRTNPRQHPSPEIVAVLGEEPRIAFESNSQETQKRLALAGVGAAYLARFMVEAEIAAGTLAEFTFRESPVLKIYAGHRPARGFSHNAKVFLHEVGLPLP